MRRIKDKIVGTDVPDGPELSFCSIFGFAPLAVPKILSSLSLSEFGIKMLHI